MAKTTPKPAAKHDDRLKTILADFDQYSTYAKPYKQKWEDYWKLWNNQRIDVQYDGVSDHFEPMTHQVVESIVSNVYGSRPKPTFVPTEKDQEQDTKTLNALWDKSWDCSNMDREVLLFGRGLTITGNAPIFCHWEDGVMKMTPRPIADCFFDASATRSENMRFAGYRRLAMLDDLRKEKMFDPAENDGEGGWVKRYNIPETVETWGKDGKEPLDKAVKEAYAGSLLGDTDKHKQAEVLYIMYLDKFYEVLNRKHIIYEGENPFKAPSREVVVQLHDDKGEGQYPDDVTPEELPEELRDPSNPEPAADWLRENGRAAEIVVTVPEIKPFLPVVLQRVKADPSLLLGMGMVEPFAPVQEYLNDLINMSKDDLAYEVAPVQLMDQSSAQSVDALARAMPRDVVLVQGNPSTAVAPMLRGRNQRLISEEIERAKQTIRDIAGVDEVVQGLGTSSKTTATEINAQVAQATGAFATMARTLESEAYKQLGDMFVKMVQIFLTEEQVVRITGRNGAEFKAIDPEKYWGTYEVKMDLEDSARADMKMESEKAERMMSAFAGDPMINQEELKKFYLQKAFNLDDDDIKRLMDVQQSMMADPMAGAPMDQMADPAIMAQGDPMASPAPLEAPAMPMEGAPVAL